MNEKEMQETWRRVDDYFAERLAPVDEGLEAALKANREAGLPPIDVTRLQGKFLELLVRMTGARRVLEIGTLGGYSTLWMARALPADGKLVTLECNARHADVARENLRRAGVLERVELRLGQALESLAALKSANAAPFDLIFVDADKTNYTEYLEWALKLSRPGTVIAGDNVVRQGKVTQADHADANVQGVQRFTERMAAEPRLSATVLQLVSGKGYDGLALAVVLR
jgi:predicted O-methyltransferase YrrM